MTTLAIAKPRAFELGDKNDLPVIASDIIYQGAAVGVVKATGHARPLVAGDRFGGFTTETVDNSSGSAAAKNVNVWKRGAAQLAVSGAVITDIGQPVFASDDDTFVFTPTANSFVGFVKRFMSSGIVVVEYDIDNYVSPYLPIVETKSANYTLDAEDTGKALWVDTDAFTLTLPAIATELSGFQVINGGAYGAILVTISPNASDGIQGPNMTAVDDKDLLNTKATANRGDRVTIDQGVAAAWHVVSMVGTWAKQG
jgi:hypothetical protein